MNRVSKLLKMLRNGLLVAALLVALAALNFFVGCDKDDDPPVYYGPPPAPDQVAGDDAADLYAFPPDSGEVDVVETLPDVPDRKTDTPVYGPLPDTPSPVDAVEELPEVNPNAGPDIIYGPADVVDEADSTEYVDTPADIPAETTTPDVLPSWYGPVPQDAGSADVDKDTEELDLPEDCQVMYFYGPQPCE